MIGVAVDDRGLVRVRIAPILLRVSRHPGPGPGRGRGRADKGHERANELEHEVDVAFRDVTPSDAVICLDLSR